MRYRHEASPDGAWGLPSNAMWAVLLGSLAWGAEGLGLQRVAIWMFLAPLLEEVALRAGLQEALLRHRATPLAANLGAALVFGLAHVAVRGDAQAFLVAAPALLIGAVYGQTRRLRHCVVLHALMNGLWIVAGSKVLAASAGPWH